MSEYPLEHIRNIGIIAHIDAGKTTTFERADEIKIGAIYTHKAFTHFSW